MGASPETNLFESIGTQAPSFLRSCNYLPHTHETDRSHAPAWERSIRGASPLHKRDSAGVGSYQHFQYQFAFKATNKPMTLKSFRRLP